MRLDPSSEAQSPETPQPAGPLFIPKGSGGSAPRVPGRGLMAALAAVAAVVFVTSGGVLLWEMVINPRVNDKFLTDVQEVYQEAYEEAAAQVEATASQAVPDTPEEPEPPDPQELLNACRVGVIEALKERVNPDICGWLTIDGTQVDFPVLRSSNGDSDYYLYRNYLGEDSRYGSIFLAGGTDVTDDNQLLHGHSMMDGRMFWCLIDFFKPEVLKASPVIRYDTELEAGEWKIVSVLKTNTYPSQGELFGYDQGSFPTDEERMQFYYELMKRSMVHTGVDVNEKDHLLSLSTCSYEYEGFRTVIVARKVRPGEDPTVDTSQIRSADHPQMPAVWYGGTPDTYWPETFEEALGAGMIDWYSGALYGNPGNILAASEEAAPAP